MLLVGWDDNLAHAGGNGAWIVKNSWGTSWGGTCGYGAERGYFTIAYDSAGIGSNAAVVRDWRPAESAGTLLYHDEGGLQGGIGWNGTYGPYGLARLTPQQSGAATHVEVWTMGPGSVDIAIYDTFNGQTPSGLLWQKQGVGLDAAGYHSVAVDAPVAIQAGNDVSVQVRFNTTNVYTALPVDNLGPVSAARSYANRTGAAGSWLDLAGQSTPLDVGIRLRVGAAPATPTFTPTHTPAPAHAHLHPSARRPRRRPLAPRPRACACRLPMMLRQWTVVGPATNTPRRPPPRTRPRRSPRRRPPRKRARSMS